MFTQGDQCKFDRSASLLLQFEGFGLNADIFLQVLSNYGLGKFIIL